MRRLDDIDIFDGSVGQMNRRQRTKGGTSLSPAQLTNIGAAFADPLGMIDITGEYPEFPAAGVSVSDMVMQGPRSPSLIENLREGDFGAAALQGIGVVPVVGGVARTVRGLSKAKSVPLEQAERMGYKSHLYDEEFNLRPLTEGARPIGVTKTPFNEAKKFSEFLADKNIMHKTDVAKTGTVYVTVEGGQMGRNLRGEPMAGEVIYRFGDHDTGFFKGRGNIQIRTDQKQSHKDAIDHLKGVENVISIEPSGASSVAKGADRLARAQKAGFDTETVYYHGADADITEFRMPSRETGQTKTVGTGVFMSSSPEVASSYAKSIDDAVVYPVYINKKEFLKVRPAEKGNFWSRIPTDGLIVEFPDGSTKPATDVFKLEPGETDTDELSRIAKSQGRKGLIVEDVVDAGVGGAGEYRYATQYLRDKGYDVSLPIGTTKESFDKMSEVPPEIMKEARLYAKAQLYRPADVVVSFDPKNVRSVNAEFEDLDSPELLKASGGAVEQVDIFEPVQKFVGGGGVGKKLLSGKTDKSEKGIGSIPVDDETVRGSDLQFLMNIGPEGLRRQQELGSFPMPSIAVVKQDQPFQGFGSITLVGDPASFDPKRLKANVVFNADAYTVRAPKPFRLAKKGAYRDFQKRFAIVGKEFNEGRIDDLVYNLEELETKKRAVAHEYGDVLRFLNDDVIADVVFLRDRGVTQIPTEQSKVRPELSYIDRQAVRNMVKPLKKERMEWARKEAEKLFQGEEFFDASVNRDYVTGKGLIIKPFTAEEVLKFMKRRKGAAKEENMLTPGSLRASLTERLRSLPEIRAQSGKLVGNEEMTKFQNASYSRINDLAENLAPFYKYKADRLGFQDEVLGLLMDSENIGLERALTRYGFEALPEDVVQEIQRTKSFFKNAPTEYFEAKPERLVDLEEFEGAIVPEGTSEDLIEALKDAGIQIETYATPDDPQRLAARKKFEGTAFSVAGGITLVGLMAPEESYAAGPSNYAKINKAVEEQARKDAAKEGRDFDDVKAMSVQQAQAATRRAEAALFEVVLDALSGGTRQIAGGLAGLAQFREDLPRRALGDLTGEQAARRIEAMREGVSEALDYEPTSELGRELSQRAQEGIARLAAPAVQTLEPVVTGAVEQITDPQNVSPLGLLYRGGKYLYEDIFGEPEREAAKSAMDVAL